MIEDEDAKLRLQSCTERLATGLLCACLCADVRWMCRVYFHVVRDGGAKEQLAGKKAFPTDELLQFYGCVLVYRSCLSTSTWYVALQAVVLSQESRMQEEDAPKSCLTAVVCLR